MSGWEARMPWRTVTPKSVERVIRYRAGSTAGEPCVRSRSEGATALATTGRHDGAAGARTHPQPETVHAGPAAVVRLKSPLALGHGCFSSFDLVFTDSVAMTIMAAEDAATVGKLIHLAGAAPVSCGTVVPTAPSCSRIATCGRLLEGTDEICLGQTWPERLSPGIRPVSSGHKNHTSHHLCPCCEEAVGNVAERLALREKTVSFWQCRSTRSGAGIERGPHRPRARRPSRTARSSDTTSTPIANATSSTHHCPQSVDNYVDGLLSSPPGITTEEKQGGRRR